jgi:hypothetical protein
MTLQGQEENNKMHQLWLCVVFIIEVESLGYIPGKINPLLSFFQSQIFSFFGSSHGSVLWRKGMVAGYDLVWGRIVERRRTTESMGILCQGKALSLVREISPRGLI